MKRQDRTLFLVDSQYSQRSLEICSPGWPVNVNFCTELNDTSSCYVLTSSLATIMAVENT